MENAEKFERWLFQCIEDSKKKLGMTDRTLAYILLREGTHYYFRTICNDEPRDAKEHN
jgi:hypothetical protein